MDDRRFDQSSAREWIEMIEGEKGLVREGDLYPCLREWVDRGDPSEIVDIGCGQGICSEKIDLHCRRYTGIDPSPFLIKRAMDLYSGPNRLFIQGSAYALPVPDASYDAAFSVAVWHLLEDKSRAAGELGRVLKEGGHFMIVAANPDAYGEWTRAYTRSKQEGLRFEGSMRQADGSETTDVLYLHTYDEIVAGLRSARLEIHKTEVFRTAISIQGKKVGGG